MRLTEGLAGLVAEQLRPQVVADATTHPRFKYFPEAGEDPYRSFLGVPIIDRGLLQGVLVVQTIEPRTFGADDVRMLVMAGAQLAPIVSEARTLGQFVAPAHQRLARAGAEPLVELGRRHDEPVPRARSGALARARQQPDRAAPADPDRHSSRSARRSSRCTAASTTPTAGCRST